MVLIGAIVCNNVTLIFWPENGLVDRRDVHAVDLVFPLVANSRREFSHDYDTQCTALFTMSASVLPFGCGWLWLWLWLLRCYHNISSVCVAVAVAVTGGSSLVRFRIPVLRTTTSLG